MKHAMNQYLLPFFPELVNLLLKLHQPFAQLDLLESKPPTINVNIILYVLKELQNSQVKILHHD